MTSASEADKADRLIAEIEQEAREQAGEIIAAAAERADEVERAAHRRAQARMAREIRALRAERDGALRQERARIDTARRERRQKEYLRRIDEIAPHMQEALDRLWSDHKTRLEWSLKAVQEALEHLPPGGWVVEHPPGLGDGERAAISAAIEAQLGSAPEFAEDASISVGVRLRVGKACLDATPKALLADELEVKSLLLAALQDKETAP